jgi:hypothetical protein
MKTENCISWEKILIKGGLGPVQAGKGMELTFLPVTLLIGPQGTGKSLVSQLLYFFRDIQYLISKQIGGKGPGVAARAIIDSIRGGSLSSFLTTSNVSIGYKSEHVENGNSSGSERSITIEKDTRKITLSKELFHAVDKWLNLWVEDPSSVKKIQSNAVFLPAERSFFSHAVNTDPVIFGNSSLPLPSGLFLSYLIQPMIFIRHGLTILCRGQKRRMKLTD